MRHRILCALLLLGPALCAVGPVQKAVCQASGPPYSSLRPPAQLRGYVLFQVDSLSGGSVAHRYSHESGTRVTVFIYPAGQTSEVSATESLVQQESEKFILALPVGVQRGWYDNFTVAFSEPDSVQAGNLRISGRGVGAATRKGDRMAIELQYLYLVSGSFIKVRATVPVPGWEDTDVPLFARELAAAVAR